MYNNMVCADQERFVSRWIPSNLNVATRSTVPEVVDRGGKLVELRELRIISLVLHALICISLLAVQVSREVKYDGMLLAELVDQNQCGTGWTDKRKATRIAVYNEDGISSSFYLFHSHNAVK